MGLGTVFVVALVSATLLPMGRNPLCLLVKLNPDLFWPAVLVATVATPLAVPSAGAWATACMAQSTR